MRSLIALLIVVAPFVVSAQDRREKVLNDRKLLADSPHWIYNDLPKGLRQAKLANKPVLIVFRCIPCEACHEFDEQVIERDPKIRAQLDKFVCVRIPMANGLDLSTFQFDYDQSFAVMFLHHDGTILGRFGTRTGQANEHEDMQLGGFAEAMERTLALFPQTSELRDALAKKRGPASSTPSPEKLPTLAEKYTDKLDYEGKVVQSCIHCHMIREAQRSTYRSRGEAIPDEVLFPWPSLAVLGAKADPHTATTLARVDAGGIADRAGLKPGDKLLAMAGQPLVSVADAQWVLQQSGSAARIETDYERNGERHKTTLELPGGWRRTNDISWRVTTWDLRRMAFGGLVLESITPEDRADLKLPADSLALRVKHVGQYGEHARAKKAGVEKGDIVVSYAGQTNDWSESQVLAYALQERHAGEAIDLIVVRNGERKTMKLALQ